jgi:hypothetical protein
MTDVRKALDAWWIDPQYNIYPITSVNGCYVYENYTKSIVNAVYNFWADKIQSWSHRMDMDLLYRKYYFEVTKYCFTTDNLPLLKRYIPFVDLNFKIGNGIDMVSAHGSTDILEWYLGEYFANTVTPHEWLYTENAIDLASKNNHIKILDIWYKYRSKYSLIYTHNAIDQASLNGHIEVLNWFYERCNSVYEYSMFSKASRSKMTFRYTHQGLFNSLRVKKSAEWWYNSYINIKLNTILHSAWIAETDADMLTWLYIRRYEFKLTFDFKNIYEVALHRSSPATLDWIYHMQKYHAPKLTNPSDVILFATSIMRSPFDSWIKFHLFQLSLNTVNILNVLTKEYCPQYIKTSKIVNMVSWAYIISGISAYVYYVIGTMKSQGIVIPDKETINKSVLYNLINKNDARIQWHRDHRDMLEFPIDYDHQTGKLYEDCINSFISSYDLVECAICTEIIADTPYVLACHHLYHKECINRWFAITRTCPTCRKES